MLEAPESEAHPPADAGTTPRRPWSTALTVGVLTALAIVLVWLVVRQPLAGAIDAGLTVPWFGVTLGTFGAASLAAVDRAALLILLLGTAFAVMAGRRRGLLHDFLFAPGSPVNLAVVRIVIFGVVAVFPRVREAVQHSGTPDTLQTPPAGMAWLLDLIPAQPQVVTPLAVAFVVASLLACIGLWTRPAMVAATIIGLYVLAVPQFYGKVTHYHHLWWIMAVLAASRCGDALSVDAMRRAWRRGDVRAAVPDPATAYGTPIRVIWLLIALTYLFPGAWKWVSAGTEWAFSDNIRTIMYEHWTRLEGFTPPLPVDQWPLAYMLGGVAVVVFEVTFILLLFGRRTRVLAVIAGLTFHAVNFAFLRLSFATLQICYVAFIPWDRLLRRIGGRMEAVEVVEVSGRGRRLVASARAVDVFGVVHVGDGNGPLSVRAGDTVAQGWTAARLLNRRVPATWPLLPVTYAVPVRVGARWLEGDTDPIPVAASPRPPAAPVAVACVAAAIIGANTLAGVGAVTAAWPFASYPTFAGIAAPERSELVLVLNRPGGSDLTLDAAQLRRLVNWEKLDGMARPIVRGEEDALERTTTLIDIVQDAGVDVPPGTQVEVYRAVRSLRSDSGATHDPELLLTVDR
jgi:hypothetical protein